MAFNYEEFKRRWRELAAAKGVDPVQGATAFQAVDAQTEARKDTHFARARQAVYADAAKPKADQRYHDGYSAEDAARRDWWVQSEMWVGGGRTITIRQPVSEDQEDLVGRIPPPDYQAVKNIRREARRLEGQREDEVTRKEDKRRIWQEAWQEDGAARKRQVVRTDYSDAIRQLQFAFA